MQDNANSWSGARPAGARRSRRHGAVAALTGIVLLGGVSACSSSGTPAASTSSAGASGSAVSVANVTLNVGDQAGSGEEALLTAAGLINKLPFKVHWADFTSGPPILQAMAAGSVDVGGVGDAPPVFSAAAGSQIAVVSALLTNVKDDAILVPADSTITSVAQLKGKTIAVAQGTSGDYELLAALTHAGLSIKDVTADNLQPADAEAAFAAGHVDAWSVWAPYVEQAEQQNHARVLADQAGLGSQYSFVVASRAALGDPAKAQAVKDYLQLLDQAYAWSDKHQAKWAATWAQATGLPTSVMTQAAAESTDVPTPINATVLSSEQAVANAFYNAGLIPSKVDFSDFAVTTFNSVVGSSS